MITRKDIENEAREALNNVFKDRNENVDRIDNEREVVLDKARLTQEIDLQKNNKEKEIQSLNVLRNRIDEEAKEAYIHTFKDKQEVVSRIDNEKEVVLDQSKIQKVINLQKQSLNK